MYNIIKHLMFVSNENNLGERTNDSRTEMTKLTIAFHLLMRRKLMTGKDQAEEVTEPWQQAKAFLLSKLTHCYKRACLIIVPDNAVR
jgi:hypothetical protein